LVVIVADESARDVLSASQRRRWPPVSVAGLLALPDAGARAFVLASALGKGGRNGRADAFEPLSHGQPDWVLVSPTHRDRVVELLEIRESSSWRKLVRAWESAGMAHRCADVRRGSVVLFLHPNEACARCEAVFSGPEKRSSQDRRAVSTRPPIVPTSGDALRDEEGDAASSVPEGSEAAVSTFGAARDSWQSKGVPTEEIGDPMDDEEYAAFRRTERETYLRRAAR
jgi:hypothetical protein